MSALQQIDALLHRLFVATLRHESLVAARDTEVLAIQKQHAAAIEKSAVQAFSLEAQIQTLYLDNRVELEPDDKKSVQLAGGIIGMRAPTHPALIPLSAKWDWEKITAQVRAVWAKKYFHKPQAPGLDKVKLKKDLTTEQLKELGLKLDTDETFFLELNRLAVADPLEAETSAQAA